MTFDPNRRGDQDDPIRRRRVDGEGSGWVPAIVAVLILLGFAYLIFWGPALDQSTRESKVQTETTAPAAPAPTPKAPN
jgi:hypothetical protein